jgi:hypothetical protein
MTASIPLCARRLTAAPSSRRAGSFAGVLAGALALLAAAGPAAARDKLTAEPTVAGPLFAKSAWTVASTSCPVGCADAMRDFLKAQTGRPVRLAPDRIDAPFLDACSGTLRWVASTSTVSELASELAKTNPLDNGVLKAADLGLPEGATLHRAVAYCTDGGFDLPVARLLSIEPDRILMLFEQQSLIELR